MKIIILFQETQIAIVIQNTKEISVVATIIVTKVAISNARKIVNIIEIIVAIVFATVIVVAFVDVAAAVTNADVAVAM